MLRVANWLRWKETPTRSFWFISSALSPCFTVDINAVLIKIACPFKITDMSERQAKEAPYSCLEPDLFPLLSHVSHFTGQAGGVLSQRNKTTISDTPWAPSHHVAKMELPSSPLAHFHPLARRLAYGKPQHQFTLVRNQRNASRQIGNLGLRLVIWCTVFTANTKGLVWLLFWPTSIDTYSSSTGCYQCKLT